MRIKIFGLLFVGLLTTASDIHATFVCGTMVNNGLFSGTKQHIIARESYTNNGKIDLSESVQIEVGDLRGNGVIKAPKIIIFAKEFNYTGTIECSQEAVITTQKPVDQSTFKMAGAGTFKFCVEQNFVLPSEKSLNTGSSVDPKVRSDLGLDLQTREKIAPVNVLPARWKEALKDCKDDITPTSALCKVSIHVVADCASFFNKAYRDFYDVVREVSNFMKWDARFSSSPLDDLYKRLQALPLTAIENGKMSGFHSYIDYKNIPVSEITDSIDQDTAASHATFAVFILYDSAKSHLANISCDAKMPLTDVLQRFFDPTSLRCYGAIQHCAVYLDIVR